VDDGIAGRIAGKTKRPPGRGEMGIHEEVAESGVRQVLFDPPAHSGSGSRGPRLPWPPGTIGAFREPAAHGRATENTPVFGYSDGQLQPDAFITSQQRQIAVSGGRPDNLDPSGLFQGAKRTDEILPDTVKQFAQPEQTIPPESHQWEQVAVTGGCEGGGCFVAGIEALVEERLHFGHKRRRGELIGENGREPDRDWCRDRIGGQTPEHFQQRKVGIERRLAQPIAAMGPAPMVQHVR
jgi:hypothetical protein